MSLRLKRNTETEEIAKEQSLPEIVQKVQTVSEESALVEKLVDMKPTFDQFHEDLIATESNRVVIEKNQKEFLNKCDEWANKVSNIISEAPQKLKITVVVSDADILAIQKMYADTIQEIKVQHEKQLQDIRDKYDHWLTSAYEHSNKLIHEIRCMLRSNEGFYVSGFMYWVYLIFFWIGVIVTFGSVFATVFKMASG